MLKAKSKNEKMHEAFENGGFGMVRNRAGVSEKRSQNEHKEQAGTNSRVGPFPLVEKERMLLMRGYDPDCPSPTWTGGQ